MKFQNSNKNIFWKEVMKIKAVKNCNNSCIDNICITADTISIFDGKYENVLYDYACQTSSFNIEQSK